ncbi:MAG: hypothetical protein NT003_00835 [Candidatus Magasanikbacteria bacterium]|nr:hypothetical protein [Candidatus Magasanikbacteria bacterium]
MFDAWADPIAWGFPARMETRPPLDTMFCHTCGHVDREKAFRNYGSSLDSDYRCKCSSTSVEDAQVAWNRQAAALADIGVVL